MDKGVSKWAFPTRLSSIMARPMTTNTDTTRLLLRLCHDLKTSVRTIRAHTELLLRDKGTGPVADLEQRLGFIAAGARNLDSLIDRLTAYSVALETPEPPAQSIGMDVLVRGALARLEQLLRENGAEVSYDPLPRVRANSDRLIQLLEELVRNAVTHGGHAGARVHISAARQGDQWLFRIRDNGQGVEAGDLERIFRPLERLHRTGPGMGLAICKAIIESHGGRIWAEPPAGDGFAVCFTLPS